MAGVFSRLVGQDAVEFQLRAAARAARGDAAHTAGSVETMAAIGTMTHAWLITGPPGSGRSVAALCFAAALQCTSDGEPGCGECRACTTT
ncbi:MAG: DNA polymerase III subunit delta', partial [Actinomycetia bacterium]|nr:DNA polymerase III subunit delta' [Actinomycetes bacterium]